MYKIRPFVNSRIMKTLYYSLTYPHLLYAVEVWGSAVIERLLLLQKRIVRLLTYSDARHDFSFMSSDPLFFKEKILKIHDIFKMQLAKFVYNCVHKSCL